MKNILLLGNGFDLYYKLPTRYIDFLNVVNFLIKNHKTSYKTIGDIFSEKSLQETDVFISICYNAHQQTFNNTLLDMSDVSEIIRLTEKNIWFSYLNRVLNKDIGWIDFEKEISFVLKCFEIVFDKSTLVHFKNNEKDVQFVINYFGFYIDKVASRNVVTIGANKVNSEYCIERPIGSGNYVVNYAKVVDKLNGELSDLAKALKLYLKCFVENSFDLLKNDGTCQRIDCFSHIEKAITFNYTNTYERLYWDNVAFHIHGNINGNIVLGVNPDESDTAEGMNTTFVCFKKYFQRTLFETDYRYLRWINEFVDTKISYRLFVMGHSLDITDKDIIVELFDNAKEIIVLYHDISAKKSYIANLVKIFGKNEFDILKKDKKLTFVSLNQELASLNELLSKESWDDLFESMHNEEKEKRVII